MYKISDFSESTDTPIATLRYYDSIDLLKPAFVDDFTGYRYYDEDQIKVLKKINKLKETGLSLDDIKKYIDTENKEILINKMLDYKVKSDALFDYFNDIDSDEYTVLQGNYDDFVRINGELHLDNPRALEVKSGNDKYYYVIKNGRVYTDYTVVETNDNWITILNRYLFKNKELISAIASKMKEDGYEYMTEICPVEMEDIIECIKEQFETESEIVTQAGYEYEKIKMKL